MTGTNSPFTFAEVHARFDEPAADLALTARELEVRELTRTVVSEHVAPHAARLDEEHEFAHNGVQALARAGLCGLLFPRDLGGSDDSTVAYALAMEEITAACPATSLVFMTQMHAAYPILLGGVEEVQHAYIPRLLNGSAYGSLGITEPDAGSDVASMSTTAVEKDGGWSLSGQKTFITTGDRADVIVCFASVDRSRGRDGISAFVVEGDAEGLTRGAPFAKLGMHASSTAELFLDDVRVDTSRVLGEVGGGWSLVMSSVVKSRISAAAQGVGIARAVYAGAVEAITQVHGPKPPEDVVFALAELRGRVLQGRLLLHAVARQVDLDPDVTPGQIAMMKQQCTDLGFNAAVDAVGLLGPLGDLRDVGLERYLRDAKVTQIYDGTNEIQRLLIGREILRAQPRVADRSL